MEGTHDNDDEELTFITLSAATQNVIRYLGLDEKKDEECSNDRQSGDRKEEIQREKMRYVARRLADLSAFERRANGVRGKKD